MKMTLLTVTVAMMTAILIPAQAATTTAATTTSASASASDTENSQTLQSQQSQSQAQTLHQQAEDWGLSTEEYQRYQQLMTGPRGIQSPGLDPLSVLGIEATNPAQRREYAEKWVRQEFARTQKELTFQREINAAWQRLYPDVLSVTMSHGNAGGIAHDSGGRLALFVKAADCPSCDARLAAVLADDRPVDIYLVDSHNDDTYLRNWARDHHIPVQKVRSRQITLNHDSGRWQRFGNGRMPVLLQQEEDGWHIVAF